LECKNKGITFILDISTTFALLLKNEKPLNFDYLLSDLSYCSGIEGNAGGVVLSNE